MQKKYSLFTILLLTTILLTACQAAGAPTSIPSTPTAVVLTTPTPAGVSQAGPSTDSTSAVPTLIPTMMAGELAVVRVEMQVSPELEPMLFTSVQGRKFSSQDFSLGDVPFPDLSYFDNSNYCMKNELDGSALVACQHYNQDGTQGWVDLTQDGREIYRIDTGSPYPANGLQGLWVYDHHWVLETIHITTHQSGNEVSADLAGQISADGVLLNEQHKYDEAFAFQTIHGKPFFLFKRDGKIGFAYDGAETFLDYDAVPHYRCCSAAVLNPQAWVNHVNFFGMRGDTWFFVTIGSLNP